MNKQLSNVLLITVCTLFAWLFVACDKNNDQTDEFDPTVYESYVAKYLGTWYYSNPQEGISMSIEISTNLTNPNGHIEGAYSYVLKKKGEEPKVGRLTYRVESNGEYLEFIAFPLGPFYANGSVIGNELWIDRYCFTRQAPEEDETPTLTGNAAKIVGKWRGGEYLNQFYCEFKADGSYTDYLVIDGEDRYPESGKYSLSGNTLILPSSNIGNAWGEGDRYAYTISFSDNDNTLTLTNSMLESFKTAIVLKRQ